MNWIHHPVILTGKIVSLHPLSHNHFDALLRIAQDATIWTHLPFDGTQQDLLQRELQAALLKRIAGEQYPFVIIDNESGAVVGSTRLFDLHPEHKKLEIGWTWNAPAFWGKGHNTEAKLLLLGYCFEKLRTSRVQLKTRNTNLRSRAAIEKIGGRFEGILRKDRISKAGIALDSFMFSILDDEWPEVKQNLTARVNNFLQSQAH